MKNKTPLLTVKDLRVCFQDSSSRRHTLIHGISFSLFPGKTLALVGESGCGKSLTAQALVGLFQSPGITISGGSILYHDTDLTTLSPHEMKRYLNTKIGFISQNPLQALNPTLTIGYQLREACLGKSKSNRLEADHAAYTMLQMVGIPDAKLRLSCYPHEMSGGMRQRVLIAMALINRPEILIADEPTTALDVTIQAEILDILRRFQSEMHMGVLFITHDLGVVAELADTVMVMYAGRVVETADVFALFSSPRHPYTKGLLAAIPSIGEEMKALNAIPGKPPTCHNGEKKCAFHERCVHSEQSCTENEPELISIGVGRSVRCLKELS